MFAMVGAGAALVGHGVVYSSSSDYQGDCKNGRLREVRLHEPGSVHKGRKPRDTGGYNGTAYGDSCRTCRRIAVKHGLFTIRLNRGKRAL